MLSRDFIEKFTALNGRKVNVQIKHALYGNQKLNRHDLRPFADEGRVGLIMDDGEEKYITVDELCEASIDDAICCIKSDVLELYIDYTVL